jgi:hypothetical protein
MGAAPLMTSLFFRVRNVPAALFKALGGFATNGINLLKIESFIEALNNDKEILKKIQNFGFNLDYFKCENNTLRYLNMFSFDVYKTLSNVHKFFDLLKKLKFPLNLLKELLNCGDENLYKENDNSFMSGEDKILPFIFLMGKDNSQRTVIGIEVAKLISTKPLPLDLFSRIFNKIIIKELQKGKVDQIVLLLDLREVEMQEADEDSLKLLQYLFPSRVHKIIVQMPKKTQLIYFLKKNLLYFNLDRVKIFSNSKVETIKEEMEKKFSADCMMTIITAAKEAGLKDKDIFGPMEKEESEEEEK